MPISPKIFCNLRCLTLVNIIECIRKTVASRLRELNLTTLGLPLISKVNEAHVPILVSSNLSTASHIIVVFGEPVQDLGIWAYRSIGVDGINAGY